MYQLGGGGAEKTIMNIINTLDNNKFEIVLVLGTDKNNDYLYLVPEWIKVKHLYCSKLRYCFFRLRKTIIRENPDLIFTTMNPNNIMAVIAKYSSFKNIPIIIREANNRTESRKVSKINKVITTIIYGYSDKIVALSKGVKDDLVYNFNIDNKKIRIIYNPVDIAYINMLKDEKVDDLDFGDSGKTIISVGRLEEQKDFFTLIKAFKLVLESIDAKLIILGKGSLEAELMKLCIDLGIEDKVTFYGFTNNPYKYVKKSDLFVLTSKWEGFGHVIVEAMAVGTPVVVTNCKSGPYEIIKDDEFGLLTEVGNQREIASSIVRLLQDGKMQLEYSEKGIQRANDFNSEKIVREYEELFTEVIKKKV